jgi:hypothetical protein
VSEDAYIVEITPELGRYEPLKDNGSPIIYPSRGYAEIIAQSMRENATRLGLSSYGVRVVRHTDRHSGDGLPTVGRLTDEA